MQVQYVKVTTCARRGRVGGSTCRGVARGDPRRSLTSRCSPRGSTAGGSVSAGPLPPQTTSKSSGAVESTQSECVSPPAGDYPLDYKTPCCAKSSVVKSTFYARNGVFSVPSATDTLG